MNFVGRHPKGSSEGYSRKNTWVGGGGGWGGGWIYFSMGGWCGNFSNYMGRWCLIKSTYMGGWSGSMSNSVGDGWLLLPLLHGSGGKNINCPKKRAFINSSQKKA